MVLFVVVDIKVHQQPLIKRVHNNHHIIMYNCDFNINNFNINNFNINNFDINFETLFKTNLLYSSLARTLNSVKMNRTKAILSSMVNLNIKCKRRCIN